MKRTIRSRIRLILSGMMMIMILAFAAPSVSRAYVQASGVITADAAKVRKEPSTQSDTISSLLKGAMVTVIDEVKDSAGALWYKVSFENSTGYVRSDLMLKATAPTTALTTTTTTSSVATNASQPAATQVTAIAETKAYVSFKSARVRQGASTQHEIVGSAVENTPVVITGEAKGTDGKKWYQVRYTNQNGREVVGFIRSDLVTVGDPPAPAATAPAETPAETPAEAPADTSAEQPAEEASGQPEEGGEGAEGNEEEGGEGQQVSESEPQPEDTVKPDYEMVYQANSEGVEEWYLFDNINGTQQSLANLRAAAEAGEKLSLASSKQASTQKIIIIVLGVLAAVLAVIVAFLLFKLKDMYEDDEEDEEDEDEEEEDEDEEEEDEDEEEEEERIIRRRRPAASVKERPQKPAPAVKAKPVKERERKPAPVKQVEYDPEDEFEAGQPVVQKQQPKRKAKNFLIEDDEFEFEFLNMDDKK